MIEINAFREFLESVRADEFNRSSAQRIVNEGYAGSAGFLKFTKRRHAQVCEEFEEHEGNVNPIVFLANGREERVFLPDSDETNRQFFARMHREATAMGATMVFSAMVLYAANTLLDFDATDAEQVRQAIERGDVARRFGWYAEHQEYGTSLRRSGIYEIDGGKLGEHEVGDPQNAPLFHGILNGS